MDKDELTSLSRIDEEHSVPLVFSNFRLDRRKIFCCTPDFASKGECTPFAELGLDPHITSHEIDEFLRDGQAQACATESSCC